MKAKHADKENEDHPADGVFEPEELSILSEFLIFLRENKKWWLIPMVTMILLLGIVVFLGSSPLAPFVYPFF